MKQEFVVTGHLKDLSDNQTLILHRAFMTESKEKAIVEFYDCFQPELEILKIFSVVDQYGNIV
jgi:hypothetical protein